MRARLFPKVPTATIVAYCTSGGVKFDCHGGKLEVTAGKERLTELYQRLIEERSKGIIRCLKAKSPPKCA